MGLSSSTTKSTSTNTTKPLYEGQVLGTANNLQDAYNANRGNVSNIQSILSSLAPTVASRVTGEGTPLAAAKDYTSSLLNSTYTPPAELQDIVNLTNRDIGNSTAASLGTRGLTGGSALAKITAGKMADAETGLRYQDLTDFRNRQAQAAQLAPSLTGADATNISSLLGLSDSAANLGTDNANRYAATMAGLLGPYTSSNGTGTQTSSNSIGGLLGGILGSWAGTGFKLSDARAKEDIRKIGATDAGLPIYSYRYIGDPETHIGILAQDVRDLQPDALGPEVNGFLTVNYEGVR